MTVTQFCHSMRAASANQRSGWHKLTNQKPGVTLHDKSWHSHDIRDIGTLSLIISSLQTSGTWWMLQQNATLGIFWWSSKQWTNQQGKWQKTWVWHSCYCWPSTRCPRVEKFPTMNLWIMIKISFFCSSIIRIQLQQWAPAQGIVDRNFKTFHIFVQGFNVMTAADTKMHWDDQTFQKFLFQNTEPYGFPEAHNGHCAFGRQGEETTTFNQANSSFLLLNHIKVPVESSGLNVRKISEEKDEGEAGHDDDLSSWLFQPGISYSFLSSPRNTWRQVHRGRPGAEGETQQPIRRQSWDNQPITLQGEKEDKATELCFSRFQTLVQAVVKRP